MTKYLEISMAQRPLVRLMSDLQRAVVPYMSSDYEFDKPELGDQLRAMVDRAAKEANLPWDWGQRCRLIEMFEFSEKEIDLLKDLQDAGGKSVSRNYDDRFSGLGLGQGGKKAVSVGAQGSRWTVSLTQRGSDLIEDWDKGDHG